MSLPTVCILAGGIGSRLGEHVRAVPKPLVEVAGEPFLFHQLRLLRRHGAQQIVLCVAYLGETIVDAIGDGAEFGLEVGYSFDGPERIGTAGAVRQALPQLGPEFLVLYGDTYLRIDYADVVRVHRASGLPATMTVLRNQGRWDTSNATFDGRLVGYDKHTPSPQAEWIDYGLAVVSERGFTSVEGEPADLADVYAELSRRGELAGYEATERFFEIGTPEALAETSVFLQR
ncbi:sugar phosphate nucleotidyltransferase [Solirubrobacter phytolaccae]|uniref:Sugar phosphate nucleotidyltransferase n=1 Tax=Solirubrobacter phytolaccae TaxID=1404360 RepID=A0A9X3S975_9ACTN|nr:sugar phosphate nucleotidyltransferase [Solirubrobacter phytolaccae]MDA0182388.1 sugar phosphate nucleotidyltransferase [Solirubrobacter phytolaccae]